MSDTVVIQVTTAILSLIGTMFTGVMAYLVQKLNRDLTIRADQIKSSLRADANDIRSELASNDAVKNEKLDNLEMVAKATHRLVNSNMASQLRINMEVTRRIAGLTCHPRDVLAADAAETLYREHEASQKQVDDSPGTDDQHKGIS